MVSTRSREWRNLYPDNLSMGLYIYSNDIVLVYFVLDLYQNEFIIFIFCIYFFGRVYA
jgi:hypothetical protein